ncbi:GRAM domain-containing protein 2B-like isoform X2 [Cyclopterus lumpus]|uniref:GRAM domain-containing protein 2B-like isoform X2 n=1 Tax=Cyclopterus lumpus TaxID=8103 RepID=UPI001486EBDE|nr:GRAM domain-containing protein 2B-like isoform X2 [Cyclopterus lumpus]
MCMSWKCLFSIMTVRSRRFSLDSSICLDRVGVLDSRRSSSRFSIKKPGECPSLDDARLEIQELNHSLTSSMKQTIAEENIKRSDGLIHKNSFLKHSRTFHKLFQDIPVGENLTHTFTCALQKEVPYHGKLFVSENFVCFHSSVLLKDTKVVIPASSVQGVKKHNSTLSMLSIQTADGEKHTFVSLRHRELCYKLLQTVCSHVQETAVNSSPHVSSAENEADHDVHSSYSSLEDCGDRDLGKGNGIYLDNSFPQMSSEAPTRRNSTIQNTDGDNQAVSWIWRITERVSPLFLLRELRNLSTLFYVYMMLTVLLLLASGYMGLRIIALEEQLSELSVQHREYQQV